MKKIYFFLRRTVLNLKFILGIIIGFSSYFLSSFALHYSSTDEFCGICHVHPQAEILWKKSAHYKNKSGIVVHCAECHLPPGGIRYLTEKTRLGLKDAYGYFFKDTKKIDWEEKSTLEYASTYMFDSSCMRCHQDLYSLNLAPKGIKAHEYFMKSREKENIHCINCHLYAGHYNAKKSESSIPVESGKVKIPSYPPFQGKLENFTETIPGSEIVFNMIAIKGGEFLMGSGESEPYRKDDEGKSPHKVRLSSFWIGEIEVSWQEYDLFFSRTSTHKKTVAEESSTDADTVKVDAITGPTPPYGSPDQNWGKGLRPALTMSYYAATQYCAWLSKTTGKKYRLPTEAEWEYACRAGSTTPYFFEGDPRNFTSKSWWSHLLGGDVDDSIIRQYVWFKNDSNRKTQPPYSNKPNPWGLYNMLGNVREFCSDWYAEDSYKTYEKGIADNPKGPASGEEHVVRGGSYNSDPSELRCASRDHTLTNKWLVTDPQSPKSIWWYSDCKDVGFRVVCEFDPAYTDSTGSGNNK